MVTLEVSGNGADYSQANSDYRYYAPMQIMRIEPSEGLDGGGTVVTLLGSNFRDEMDLTCSFGQDTAGRVKARWVTASTVTCQTPERWAGNTSIGLWSRGGMEAMSDETFRFEARWQLTTLHPSEGTTEGGTRVTLAGSGVGDVDGLRCRIGSVVVESEKSSGSSVVCVTPMHRAGTVRVGLCYGGSGHCGAGEIAIWTPVLAQEAAPASCPSQQPAQDQVPPL